MSPRGVGDNGKTIVEPIETAGDCQLESTGGLSSGRDASTVTGHGGRAENGGGGGRLLLASSEEETVEEGRPDGFHEVGVLQRGVQGKSLYEIALSEAPVNLWLRARH